MEAVMRQTIQGDVRHMGNVESIPRDLLVPHYLIHSYLYYNLNHSVITDDQYDRLARRLSDEWSEVSHVHKHLIEREQLASGGSGIKYPTRVRLSAEQIYRATTQPLNSTQTINSTMPINARSKGRRGEREIIDLLQPHINEVSDYNQVERPFLQRNQMQTHAGGYDIVGVAGWAFEVKRVEKDLPSNIEKWWKQACRQAKAGEEPVLFYRPNSCPWRVRVFSRLDLGDGRRYKVPATISIDHFIFWFKCRLHNAQLEQKKNS